MFPVMHRSEPSAPLASCPRRSPLPSNSSVGLATARKPEVLPGSPGGFYGPIRFIQKKRHIPHPAKCHDSVTGLVTRFPFRNRTGDGARVQENGSSPEARNDSGPPGEGQGTQIPLRKELLGFWGTPGSLAPIPEARYHSPTVDFPLWRSRCSQELSKERP